MSCHGGCPLRHGVVGLASQLAPAGLWRSAAPLLEEDRDVGVGTLVSEVENPCGIHLPSPGPALAAGEQPVDALDVKAGEWSEQGLSGHEAHALVDGAEVVEPEAVHGAL